MDNKKTFSTVKQPSQETIFARFLQRKAAEPTEKQFITWDDDGGQGFDPHEDYLAIVHGRICRSPFQKMMAHLSYMWSSHDKKRQPRTRYNGQ